MATSMPSAGSPAFYSIRDAAWILGISTDQVSRAIRHGRLRAVRRRSSLVIPASELVRVLGNSTGGAR